MTSNKLAPKGKNWQDGGDMPNNFGAKKPNDDSAPKIDGGGKFTPQTSQSNKRGPQGQ